MTTLNRRDFIRLASEIGAAWSVAPLLACRPSEGEPTASIDPIDYTRATTTPTICFGCTTHCGVIGRVQDGRVRRIEGNPLDPNTQGTICGKAEGMISYTYYPQRVLYPLRRVGKRGEGRWARISWDEALDEIATRLAALRDAGTPEQFIFHYGRDKTKGFTQRFTNAFGTPNRLNRRSICSSNRRVPLMSFYGREFEWESQDLANTRYVINFGANPMEAYQGGLYMVRRLMDARVDQGARMVTFEVRPSATASISDEYHVVRPGTDGVIALAMANVILEEGLHDAEFWARWVNVDLDEVRAHIEPYTPQLAEQWSGVPAADIRRIAIEFAQAAPRCCTMSNRGSAKHYNGVQADRAIRMLDALVGNVGREGGFCLSSLRMWKNRYGQEGLPVIDQPAPHPPSLEPWRPGTRQFETLPPEVQERVAAFPEAFASKYYGELATPSEYPLSYHYYNMRVGQLVYPYIAQGRATVGVYMSYTLGASYGYPEAAVAREVLADESLVPFHVAIDISYSEQAALADIILPDATSLERWDAHSTNNYGLVPYTGIRQPLHEPLGQARPVQIILRDLARRIGGGMDAYFDFEDLEDYYREWYREVPLDWQTFKARGIWYDEQRPLDYELYEREVPQDELEGSTTDPDTSIVSVERDGKSVVVGIQMDDRVVRGFPTPSRKIQVKDEIFALAATHTGLPLTDINAQVLPTFAPVPEHEDMGPEDFHLTTFKWNVHTQGRSAYWKYQTEIVHTNQLFIHPESANDLGLSNGDEVEVTVFRPKQHTYRAGESEPVGRFVNRVRLLPGMHPRVVACSHHAGHWEHGSIATADDEHVSSAQEGMDPAEDSPSAGSIWWSKDLGGVGNGIPLNDALPINPTPLVGGQSWFDNVCRIRKL